MGVNICCCAKVDTQAIKTLQDTEKTPFIPSNPSPPVHQSPLETTQRQDKKTTVNQGETLGGSTIVKRNFLNTEQNELEESMKKQFFERRREEFKAKQAEKLRLKGKTT